MTLATYNEDPRFHVIEVKLPKNLYLIKLLSWRLKKNGYQFMAPTATWVAKIEPHQQKVGQQVVAMFNQMANEIPIPEYEES